MDSIILFNKIRDMPLRSPESIDDKDLRCWGKHRKLYVLLKKNGFDVRYRVCEFFWSKQRISPQLIKLAKDKNIDKDQHLFLEIKIKSVRVILDCSNDSKLPEYNVWDGSADCKIAVNYEKIFSPEESAKIEINEKINFKKNFENYKEFYVLLNKFFDGIRKK